MLRFDVVKLGAHWLCTLHPAPLQFVVVQFGPVQFEVRWLSGFSIMIRRGNTSLIDLHSLEILRSFLQLCGISITLWRENRMSMSEISSLWYDTGEHQWGSWDISNQRASIAKLRDALGSSREENDRYRPAVEVCRPWTVDQTTDA